MIDSHSSESDQPFTPQSALFTNVESDFARALPTFTKDRDFRQSGVAQEYSPQPSTPVHRHYLSHRFTFTTSSHSTIALPSAIHLVQALQTEVKGGRKKESVDGYLVKMYEMATNSEKGLFKLVNAGAVPTLIHLLKVRAAEQHGVEVVLITLGTFAARDPISANAIYRTGTATTLVELFDSPSTDAIQALAIWCLTLVCRSAEVAKGLIKLNLPLMLVRVQAEIGPIIPAISLFFLGSLIRSDKLAEALASLDFVQMICTHLRRCSELDVPNPESVSAGLYAVARMSRSIPLAKALAKAGCVEVIAHYLKTSTDPEVLHWSARAVGCLMRPNSSDLAKTLLDADIAKGLARLPTVLLPGSLRPLESFGFAIQRFSCAEWGSSTRKALVEAGVVDSLLAALRPVADERRRNVHVELALAVCFLGGMGGSSIRKEIINAGGIEVLESVGAAGSPDVIKACNMAVTSITGNLFSRSVAAVQTAMAHQWSGGCPDYYTECPLTIIEERQVSPGV